LSCSASGGCCALRDDGATVLFGRSACGDIPEDWVCPNCGTPKSQFEMVAIGYAADGPELAQIA
jgi:hypothetical protein